MHGGRVARAGTAPSTRGILQCKLSQAMPIQRFRELSVLLAKLLARGNELWISRITTYLSIIPLLAHGSCPVQPPNAPEGSFSADRR